MPRCLKSRFNALHDRDSLIGRIYTDPAARITVSPGPIADLIHRHGHDPIATGFVMEMADKVAATSGVEARLGFLESVNLCAQRSAKIHEDKRVHAGTGKTQKRESLQASGCSALAESARKAWKKEAKAQGATLRFYLENILINDTKPSIRRWALDVLGDIHTQQLTAASSQRQAQPKTP